MGLTIPIVYILHNSHKFVTPSFYNYTLLGYTITTPPYQPSPPHMHIDARFKKPRRNMKFLQLASSVSFRVDKPCFFSYCPDHSQYQACCKYAHLKESSHSFVIIAQAHKCLDYNKYNQSSENCFCQSLSYFYKHKICSQRKTIHQKWILNMTKSAMTFHLMFLTASFSDNTYSRFAAKESFKNFCKAKQNKIRHGCPTSCFFKRANSTNNKIWQYHFLTTQLVEAATPRFNYLVIPQLASRINDV